MVIKPFNRRKQLYKSIAISSIIINVLIIGIVGYFGSFIWFGPRCTTCFFHFNIDYRLGLVEVEDRIIREPYYKLLKLYEKHPNWDFTVECQAEMILRIFNNSEYEEIKNLTIKLLNRKQLELLCAVQYSELFYAYPADVFELNLIYANQTLADLGLLNQRSNCILFQEGQFAYGLATLLNSVYASNIDTVLVSAQQVKGFRYPGYNKRDYPVFILNNLETGKSIKILQYDYFPKWEAGYFHSWIYLYDGELAFEDEDAELEFTVSEDKLRIYEEELLLLEREGNKFFTCSDWVAYCESQNAIGTLNYYIPECNWANAEYNSSYTWAAKNSDSTDDGEMLANNYRCRHIIYATKMIYEKYKTFIAIENQTLIEIKFESAEKLWLQATCSDSTGVGPDPIERITAEQNVLTAQKNCSEILQIIANNIVEVNVSQIQVDLLTETIFNNTDNFISLINIVSNDLSLSDLPINVIITSEVDNSYNLEPNVSVRSISYNSSDASTSSEVFNLFQLDVIFEGTHDWANDSISEIAIQFEFKELASNFQKIVYSPSLLEENIKTIARTKYRHDPLYIFLPLSNGFLFIPNQSSSNIGTMIVKNVTRRHTSWLWEDNYIKIIETEGIHLDAHHQFFIMDNISIDKALNFANRVNLFPPWIVSKNLTKIQGNEVYNVYDQMENKLP
ncbi:MAG: hypothetical protein ACFFD5_01665 [Candidatus Thorarchaeota archaeon]